MDMTIRSAPVWQGNTQFGMVHTFPEAGCALPRHAHDAATVHSSTVARGRFRVTSERYTGEIDVGAHIIWEIGEDHEFVALEPGSIIVQLLRTPSCS